MGEGQGGGDTLSPFTLSLAKGRAPSPHPRVPLRHSREGGNLNPIAPNNSVTHNRHSGEGRNPRVAR